MSSEKVVKKTKEQSIRNSIYGYFTFTALVAVCLLGLAMYIKLSSSLTKTVREDSIGRVNQINLSVESYIRNAIRLSNSAYYGVIKNTDLDDEIQDVVGKLALLREGNKVIVEDIALISKAGELLEVVPASRIRTGYKVNKEEWFSKTLEEPDTVHFFNPEVQYIFDIAENQYKWVNKLTRAVEVTKDGKTEQAVLLIDLNYSGLDELISNVKLGKSGYVYLMDADGNIIWHPKGSLVSANIFKENNMQVKNQPDGTYEERFDNQNRTVIIKTVGYTGWRVVGVMTNLGISFNLTKDIFFLVFIFIIIILLVSLANGYISIRITKPISELEKSVNELDRGNLDARVYIGGYYEIQHLGSSVNELRLRIKKLMKDLDEEHELKMKKEFEVLQEQINPHFLYNTLESIVWMIESEKAEVAVKMVTSLAKFFRVALSEGETIINVKNEIEHVRNYLMIQSIRMRSKFEYTIDISPNVDAENTESLKIMLQPIVENAIYHGMEYMEGEGLIEIKVWVENQELYFMVKDNGPGMTQETMDNLLSSDTKKVQSKRGSGIGVKNVNERIKLYFGAEYGLFIRSELDVGTEVYIHIPVKRYMPKNGRQVKGQNE